MEELADALSEKQIDIIFDKKVYDYIALKCDGTKTGAREIRNIIRREIEDKVVDMIILGDILEKVSVKVKNNELIISAE